MSGKRGKSNISFTKPPEPNFLKRLKEEVGFQEGPTIETKRQRREFDDDEDRDDFDDEKPVIVQLRPGDLSQEEAERLLDGGDDSEEEGENKARIGKITFKKPEKKTEESSSTIASSKKLKPIADRSPNKKANSSQNSDSTHVKNKCLLSFNDEEHDD